MNSIHPISYRAAFASSECTWIAIDDIPIEQWCAEEFNYPGAVALGLALMWLADETEEQLAWARILPGAENSSTIVPLLVCSDDMDLHCTVVVVEQLVTDGTIQWLRWGVSASVGKEVGIATQWEKSPHTPLAIFAREEFDACLRGFGR